MIDYNKKYNKYYMIKNNEVVIGIKIDLGLFQGAYDAYNMLLPYLDLIKNNSNTAVEYEIIPPYFGLNLCLLMIRLYTKRQEEIQEMTDKTMMAIDILGWLDYVTQG